MNWWLFLVMAEALGKLRPRQVEELAAMNRHMLSFLSFSPSGLVTACLSMASIEWIMWQ